MTLAELLRLLPQKTDDELRDLIDYVLTEVLAAAQAVLDDRAAARRVPTQHGTGCTCCGAGVKQWR